MAGGFGAVAAVADLVMRKLLGMLLSFAEENGDGDGAGSCTPVCCLKKGQSHLGRPEKLRIVSIDCKILV